MLQAIPSGDIVNVPPAQPPPVVKGTTVPTTVIVNTNTGSATAAQQGTTTAGPATQGQSGSLNVPISEGGPAPNSPTTVTTQTTGGGGGGGGGGDGSGSATSDLTFGTLDLTAFNDSLKKPRGVGQLWNLMWATIWTRPPSVHTKIQGLNDGTQDLFKSIPYIY